MDLFQKLIPSVAKAGHLVLYLCFILSVVIWFISLSDMLISKEVPFATSEYLRFREMPQTLSVNSTNVTLITLQCNEWDILGPWLEYHAAIFGVHNILLLDNHSDRPDVLALLRLWESRGLRVLWEQGPYLKKGDLILKAAHKYLSNNIDQIIIPIDIDEFITVFSTNGLGIPVINKNLILQEIQKFQLSSYSGLGLRPYYESISTNINDTLLTIKYFYKNIYTERHSKKMVKLNTVTKIDHGSHEVLFKDNNYYVLSSTMGLGYLHYHHRGPMRTIQRALVDCIGMNKIPKNATLETITEFKDIIQSGINKRVPGHHKLTELLAYIEEGFNAPLLLHPLGFDENNKIEVVPIPELIKQLTESL